MPFQHNEIKCYCHNDSARDYFVHLFFTVDNVKHLPASLVSQVNKHSIYYPVYLIASMFVHPPDDKTLLQFFIFYAKGKINKLHRRSLLKLVMAK
jgi:hypothetical protein